MEGNERLKLYKPLKIVQDDLGQENNVWEEIKVYARRQDRGGRESVYSDTQGGQWQTRFEIRATPKVISASEEWRLVDGFGHEHEIESVTFAPFWGGRRLLYIYALRVKSKRSS